VVRLTEIFRQAKQSFIITNAHQVNSGNLPVLDAPSESDFFFIQEENPEQIVATIKSLCRDRIPQKYGLEVQL
jgi:exodeoxyribonuclease V alpha subunit